MVFGDPSNLKSRADYRLLFEDLDNVLGVDAHSLIFSEEKYHVKIPRGAEFSRFVEGILRPIREAHAKRPERLTFYEPFYLAEFHCRTLHARQAFVSRKRAHIPRVDKKFCG